MRTKRTYTDEDRAAVYLLLERTRSEETPGGNVARTSRETGIPETTVRDWRARWEATGPPAEIEAALQSVGDREARLQKLQRRQARLRTVQFVLARLPFRRRIRCRECLVEPHEVHLSPELLRQAFDAGYRAGREIRLGELVTFG